MKRPDQIKPEWLLAMLFLSRRESQALAEKVEKLQHDRQFELRGSQV